MFLASTRHCEGSKMIKQFKATLASIGVLAFSIGLQGVEGNAATISGGSDLLTASSATQMENWLLNDPTLSYSGSLLFTNVFTKESGDTSSNFHAAVDGIGPTFFVAEARSRNSSDPFQIIGGFNPASWNSSSGYIRTMPNTEADRTAFIFNLTTSERRDQTINTDDEELGSYQSYNLGNYGPTFGGGHDIHIDSSLSSGRINAYSYCSDPADNCYAYGGGTAIPNLLGQEIAGRPNNDDFIDVARLEVFTIATAPNPVPLPAAFPLFAGGLALLGFLGWRRRPE